MRNVFLFVYGTLRQRARHPLHRQLRLYAKFHGEATMQGCLFEISGYPGAVESADPEQRVKGELYRIYDAGRLFPVLDDYEQCTPRYPRPHEYRRQKIPVRTKQGDTVRAWAYIYQRTTTRLRNIPHGDYLSPHRRK